MMQFTSVYHSPMGFMRLASDEIGLTGLWFQGQKYDGQGLAEEHEEKETGAIKSAKQWLDIYFSGKEPDFTPPIHMAGTGFQIMVWEELLQIPYGTTMTYGQLAAKIAEKCGKKSMSPQAVGGAVGHNHISIIIPCHRVVGSRGQLTGYAGGLDRKYGLLKLEGALL